MRARPSSSTRSSKSSRASGKSNGVTSKGVVKKGSKETATKAIPDLSVLRQPVDTSVCGLKKAVKVFETGTPEVLHLLTYDCDVVYECKVCRNLFRSIANFISHKRIYCTVRYSRAQDLQATNKESEDFTLILGEQIQERLPTRITARKDLTSIVESLGNQNLGPGLNSESENTNGPQKKSTTIHLEAIENTSYGVFQTVVKPDSQNLMRNQVSELQKLLAQDEVVLGPDGRILQNGTADLQEEEMEAESASEDDLVCSSCNIRFANRKTLTKHIKLLHESVRTRYSCPCCKNFFANTWSVYRHLYKVHRKTNEQVRRLRTQIHKKDIKCERPSNNNVNTKKITSPSKKKVETDNNTRIMQNNKEWMDHFEDDWELQRCGGCGRKFERKAALISHAQICQKRIMACNRIKYNNQENITSNMNPIVAVRQLPCAKKPMPKQSSEKKIGIQVRMNYCKNGSQVSERQTCSRSVLGDESDLEVVSVDGKETFQQNSLRDSSVLDKFLNNANSFCASEGLDKVNSYLSSSTNRLEHYETCSTNTTRSLKNSVSKSKSLEAKCLQLRSALEGGVPDPLKVKELDSSVYFDGNTDNTSESNTSILSSLSSQLAPPVDKGFVCEDEENIPSTEADSTSMTNNNGDQIYTETIELSGSGDSTFEEVSTSVVSDSNVVVDSICLQDDEISVDLKPIDESKNIEENQLENTISILTRNQLKAICKDDLVPNNTQTVSQPNVTKEREYDNEVEVATRELTKKKLSKYIDDKEQNQCRVCSRRFKHLSDAYKHIRSHTMWKRYECLFNGCKFQTFFKSSCVRHLTTTHTNGNNDLSLLGKINPSKWNLKICPTINTAQSSTVTKLTKVIKKDVASQRLVKKLASKKLVKKIASQKLATAVNRLNKKPLNPKSSVQAKLKSKDNKSIISKKPKIVNNIPRKQKLLTDFRQFNVPNSKTQGHSKRNIKASAVQLPKSRRVLNNSLQNISKSISVENVSSDSENSSSGNSVLRRQRVSISKPDQSKVKVFMLANGQREEIVINKMNLLSNEPILGRGRASRSSSRKSSISSIDQLRGKESLDDSETFHNASLHSESQYSIHIQSSEMTDGTSSVEGEESQESDRPVDDDTHFNNIYEVIIGTSKPVQNSGRPVRNKSRPKRDSDFILGNQKEGDKELAEGKAVVNKKSIKSSNDCKSIIDISKKSK